MMHKLILLSLFAINANADEFEFTLTWKTPAERVDGSKLEASSIDGYQIYTKHEGQYKIMAKVSTVNEYTLPIDFGCIKMATVDTAGLVSDLSEEVCYSLPTSPTEFKLEVK